MRAAQTHQALPLISYVTYGEPLIFCKGKVTPKQMEPQLLFLLLLLECLPRFVCRSYCILTISDLKKCRQVI